MHTKQLHRWLCAEHCPPCCTHWAPQHTAPSRIAALMQKPDCTPGGRLVLRCCRARQAASSSPLAARACCLPAEPGPSTAARHSAARSVCCRVAGSHPPLGLLLHAPSQVRRSCGPAHRLHGKQEGGRRAAQPSQLLSHGVLRQATATVGNSYLQMALVPDPPVPGGSS